MNNNAKPVVQITHALLSSEDGVQYFAIPEDPTTFSKQAIWVALGDKEKCWIEVCPVDPSDTEGVVDFKDDIVVTVDIENSFLPLGQSSYLQLKKCRWFSELSE